MPVAAFVPLVASGIGAFNSVRNARKAQGQVGQATSAQAGLANQRADQGASLFRMAQPLLQQSGSYYSKLLRGDRAALRSSVSPEANEISDVYRGTEKNLSRMAPGALRDQQQAELARERSGRMAALVPLARRAAAGQAASLGTSMASEGGSATAGAGSMFGTLANGARDDYEYANDNAAEHGKNLGGLITDSYKAWKNRGTA